MECQASSLSKGKDGCRTDYIPGQNVSIGDDSCMNVPESCLLPPPSFSSSGMPATYPHPPPGFELFETYNTGCDCFGACTCSVGKTQVQLQSNSSQYDIVQPPIHPISQLHQDMLNLNVSKPNKQAPANETPGISSEGTITSSPLTCTSIAQELLGCEDACMTVLPSNPKAVDPVNMYTHSTQLNSDDCVQHRRRKKSKKKHRVADSKPHDLKKPVRQSTQQTLKTIANSLLIGEEHFKDDTTKETKRKIASEIGTLAMTPKPLIAHEPAIAPNNQCLDIQKNSQQIRPTVALNPMYITINKPLTINQPVTINKPIHVTDSSNINIGEHSTMIHEAPPAHTLNQPTYPNRDDTSPQTCATESTTMGGDRYQNVFGAAVKHCISELQDHYKCAISKLQPIPWCDWHEVKLTDVYTKLELEEREGVFKPIELEKIFDNNLDSTKLPKRILIRGDPGIGKSTLCRKLAYDWATGADYMVNHFDVVLLIEVRQMTGTIKDAISDQLLPHDMKDDVRKNFFDFIQNHPEKVAIILDGIDELNSNIRTDVRKLINRKIYKHLTVLVTSRPDKDMYIPQFWYDRFIVNKGYTLENAIDFIHRYFKYNVQESSCNELVDGIRTSLYLQDLATNPLNTILLCIIWQENKTMPQTKHELFTLLEYSITRRFCMKMGIEMSGNDIPDECQTLLHEISEIAFQGVLKQLYRFKESDLRKRYKNSLFYKMGFMTEELSTAIIKATTFLVFPHKTIQDRFAARYLISLPASERQCHIQTLAEKPNSYNVLVHASGYMEHNVTDITYLVESVYKFHKHKLFAITYETDTSDDEQPIDECICLILECLYESKCNAQLASKLSNFIKTNVCISLSASKASTLYAFASILQHDSCRFKSLHVIISELDHSKWEILLVGIVKNQTISLLILEGCLLSGIDKLFRLNTNIKRLKVIINKYTDYSTLEQLKIIRENQNINNVHLNICTELDHDGSQVLSNVIQSGVINQLSLTLLCYQSQQSVIVGNDVMLPLCSGLETAPFNFSDLSVTVEGPEAESFGLLPPVMSSLRNNSSLRSFSANYTASSSANSIGEEMKKGIVHRKRVLKLWDHCEYIAKCLSGSLIASKIREISLSDICFVDKDALVLSKGLSQCKCLVRFNLTGTNILDEGVKHVCFALQYHTHLSELVLRDNSFGDDGIGAVIDLCFDRALEIVDLSYNMYVTEKGAELFGQCVAGMKSVQAFGLLHVLCWKVGGRSSSLGVSSIKTACKHEHSCCHNFLSVLPSVSSWGFKLLDPERRSHGLTRHYVYANDSGEDSDCDEDVEWFDCKSY